MLCAGVAHLSSFWVIKINEPLPKAHFYSWVLHITLSRMLAEVTQSILLCSLGREWQSVVFLLDTTLWVFLNHQSPIPQLCQIYESWTCIYMGMVFIFCSPTAEEGGIIVPGGQRARSSPVPHGGVSRCSGHWRWPEEHIRSAWGALRGCQVPEYYLSVGRQTWFICLGYEEVNPAYWLLLTLVLFSGRQRWRRHWSDCRARRECRESSSWTQKVHALPPAMTRTQAGPEAAITQHSTCCWQSPSWTWSNFRPF